MHWIALASVLLLSAQVPPSIERCARSITEARARRISAQFDVISRGCATVFRVPACRKAWATAAAQPPERRVAHIVSACRAAYCGALAPRPSLCEGELKPSRMMIEGPGLVRAILDRDHGTGVVEAAMQAVLRAAGPVVVSPAPAPAPAPASIAPTAPSGPPPASRRGESDAGVSAK